MLHILKRSALTVRRNGASTLDRGQKSAQGKAGTKAQKAATVEFYGHRIISFE
ncbi:hypothetical protein AA3271_1669 [Gluconobacter japonicus NBRC 3271]|nr:hypothetical protein AA3271_1669 [Gluconobacter japonicus NBRC 3271]